MMIEIPAFDRFTINSVLFLFFKSRFFFYQYFEHNNFSIEKG